MAGKRKARNGGVKRYGGTVFRPGRCEDRDHSVMCERLQRIHAANDVSTLSRLTRGVVARMGRLEGTTDEHGVTRCVYLWGERQ